ncbi:MAG: 2-phosphoglycerate kinase [Ilumatobacter sp.]|jgi:2-phosphoglycerate kinase
MPVDHIESDSRIVVHNRCGEALPYSRGIMATSILATGIPTEEAYRLASIIQARLLHHDRRHVTADELVEITRITLNDDAVDTDTADRWMAWRNAKRSGRPIIVVLAGAPGVGKSTLATRLAVRLDITRVITTDSIREVLRLVVPAAVLPELHRSSFELIGDSAARGLVDFDRQCSAVGHAAVTVAARLATENRPMILEGVHLVPGEVTHQLANHPARPIVVERLVAVDDIERHRHHLDQRRGTEPHRDGQRHVERVGAIRTIQEHLLRTAADEHIARIDAHVAPDITQSIVDEIAAHANLGLP